MLARLTTRTLARHKGLIAGMASVLAGFQVVLVVIGANLQREGLFAQLSAIIPVSVQGAFGGATLASYGGLVAFGFFHPVVVLALGVGTAYLAAELAGDVEDGLVDLIAARPVWRGLLVARAGLAFVAAASGMCVLMVIANRTTTLAYAGGTSPSPAFLPILKLAANLLAVTLCCGAGGLAIASAARRRATAAGSAGIVMVLMYLVNFAATWWRPARPFARFTPFRYFDAMPVMLGTRDPTSDIAVLLGAAAVLSLCGYLVYRRRDL
jgi:ABC-type transport system involved in multi-copper enzyme maturation permease subunit